MKRFASPGDSASRPDAALRQAAARLRNLLDQKTGHEKQVLRRYVVMLERRLRARRGRT